MDRRGNKYCQGKGMYSINHKISRAMIGTRYLKGSKKDVSKKTYGKLSVVMKCPGVNIMLRIKTEPALS